MKLRDEVAQLAKLAAFHGEIISTKHPTMQGAFPKWDQVLEEKSCKNCGHELTSDFLVLAIDYDMKSHDEVALCYLCGRAAAEVMIQVLDDEKAVLKGLIQTVECDMLKSPEVWTAREMEA